MTMTPERWQHLLRQRARRIETKHLGNVRRVGWQSADSRMLRRMEKTLPRKVETRLYEEYHVTVAPSLTTSKFPQTESYTQSASRLDRRFPSWQRRELVHQVAGWMISPLYSYHFDRWASRSPNQP